MVPSHSPTAYRDVSLPEASRWAQAVLDSRRPRCIESWARDQARTRAHQAGIAFACDTMRFVLRSHHALSVAAATAIRRPLVARRAAPLAVPILLALGVTWAADTAAQATPVSTTPDSTLAAAASTDTSTAAPPPGTAARVAALGFENVSVDLDRAHPLVAFENRRYRHTAQALGLIHRQLGQPVTVIERRLGLPVAAITTEGPADRPTFKVRYPIDADFPRVPERPDDLSDPQEPGSRGRAAARLRARARDAAGPSAVPDRAAPPIQPLAGREAHHLAW